MFECPVCQATMEEEATLLTECCGVRIEEEETECPACRMRDPEVVEGEARLVCENCGHVE